MKKSISTFLSCLVCLLILSPSLFAQQTDSHNKDQIIIVKKATNVDGAIETDKKSIEKGEKFKVYLEQLNLEDEDAKEVKIEVFSSEDGLINIENGDNEETIFFYRSATSDDSDDQDIEKFVITLNDEIEEELLKGMKEKEPKPLLGVYSSNSEDGVRITGLVFDSGAQKAGIQKGDVLTSIGNQPVTNTDVMRSLITQHKVGESVDVEFIRDGNAQKVTVTLGQKAERRHARRSYSYHYDHDADHYYNSFQDRNPCKPFIGVYTNSSRSGGLKIRNLIANTPADRSNLQKGDKIVAIDDVEVNTHSELVTQRDKHEPGDYFTLSIIRDGQQIEVDAQFDACPTDKVAEPVIVEEVEEIPETIIPEFDITQNTLELESINVFPNPTYGPINLKFSGEAVPTTIRLTDSSGKVVL